MHVCECVHAFTYECVRAYCVCVCVCVCVHVTDMCVGVLTCMTDSSAKWASVQRTASASSENHARCLLAQEALGSSHENEME